MLGKQELNTLIRENTPGAVNVEILSASNGEIAIQASVMILIKPIKYKFKLNKFEVCARTISANLSGVPDMLMNYIKEKGWLNVQGLKIENTKLSFDVGNLIPPFANLESISIDNDEVVLKVKIG